MGRDHTWNRESLEFPDWDRDVLQFFDIFLMETDNEGRCSFFVLRFMFLVDT